MSDIEKFEKDSQVDSEQIITSEVNESRFSWYEKVMTAVKGETRGIERVPEEEKTGSSIWEAATMWFSANLVIATFSLGALSYGVFGLDFGTSVLYKWFFLDS
ncbi:unnamed protein product [[Candida] boidinii]|nr:unnamed protein product [[Candida] boidinii]